MVNYHVILTSLNTISYIYIMDYVREELEFSEDKIHFVKKMLLNDLLNERAMNLLLGHEIELCTSENVRMINGILHSYFINKLFSYVSKEDDIDLHYKPIVDPTDIVGSYFRPESIGIIHMSFQICFKTRDAYNKFKLKYPEEKEKLNFFNQTTYKCI